MTTLTRMKRKHTSESGNMEQMTSYVLVLFDYDGCTLITTPRHLAGASSEVLDIASRTTMMYKGKQHDVEILQISDSFESLDAFEDEWTDSHRSLELTQEKQRRNSRKGNKYGGFLDIWPADPQDTEENSTEALDICTRQSITTNKRPKKKQASSRIIADKTTLPKQTHIEGTNGRKATVHFEGAEERDPQHASPSRQPNFTEGLSLDQIDIVELHVQQHQHNCAIVATQTDHVILFDTAEDFRRELIQSATPRLSKSSQCKQSTTSMGTQTDMDNSGETNKLILNKLEHLINLQKRRLCMTEKDTEGTPQIQPLSRPVLRRRLELDPTSINPPNTTFITAFDTDTDTFTDSLSTDAPASSTNTPTSASSSTSNNTSTLPNESLISIYDFTSSCSTSSSLSRPASPTPSYSHQDLFSFLDSDVVVPCSGQSIYNFEIRPSDQPVIFDLDTQTPELLVEDLNAETLFNLKDNSSNKLFAWTLTKKLFTPQEFVGQNFYGNRGKLGLSPRRRRAIISAIQRTCGSGEVRKAVDAINSGLRKLNR